MFGASDGGRYKVAYTATLSGQYLFAITTNGSSLEHYTTGESRLTAAIPMDNPYCSCKLTRVLPG